MSQGLNLNVPAASTPVLSAEIRTNFAAIASMNKGPAAPANIYEGMFWLDDSNATLWALKQRLNSAWRVMLIYDLSGDKLRISSGELMAKEDFKAGISPDGTKDGVNDTFTLPGGQVYFAGTLSVFLNGQQYNPTNIYQVSPGYTSFTIINGDHLPISTDVLTISYLLA